jgi:NAD(P)-dependent dehydrogenase (short-subunit alcohol dehydrogenase family)
MTDKNIAIVTGASAGIGKAVVLRLLRAGWMVHAGARRVDEMRDLAAAGAVVTYLDLTDEPSIAAFAATALATSGRIDALINNAGYGAYGALEDVPLQAARAEMDVNVFGLARMTQLVLPAMRQQRSGRIVNVSSIGGKIWSPLGAWYHASKFAVEGLSDCLRNEVRPFGIDVIVIEPAGVKTAWTGIAVDSMRAASGAGPYGPIAERFAQGVLRDTGSATPDAIAAVIVRAVTTAKPKTRYAPQVARVILFLRWILSDRAFDGLIGRIFGLPKTLP